MERGAQHLPAEQEVHRQPAEDFETSIRLREALTSIPITSSSRKGISSRADMKSRCGYHSRAFDIRMRGRRVGACISSDGSSIRVFRIRGLRPFVPTQTFSPSQDRWMVCMI